ncbi:hypothetical protein K1X12_04015 [Hyphomonas sp. WL0036]|uniref:hypothetical protein n=1 Tax=Hyphomonas sediminis TaxID=2866160 RepID=UPI001C7F3829|nr:hypothetical protein [Hyphomonas sediminis]MBY9066049.1 hypothetical protein [Hyphomonas sediminis]
MITKPVRLLAQLTLSAALLLPGCATAPGAASSPRLVDANGQLCPGAEKFDVAKIKEKNAADAAQRETWILEQTLLTPLPPGAEEAETRIRVRVPPTGMWALDTRVTLWKSTDGVWQVATNNIDYRAPPPPPPPPPVDAEGNLLPGFEDWPPEPPPPPRPPYITSALDAGKAAALETILTDPCFLNGPDSLPYSVPTNGLDEYGRKEWLCPMDSAYYMAEVKQAGLSPRYISHSCYMDFAVSKLLTVAAYMNPSANPETK